MKRVSFHYSMKNIPTPSSREYTKSLIEKTESVIKRMRWKAFFFLHPDAKRDQINTYGFNTRNTPPQIKLMTNFEDNLLRIVENIEFRNNKCQFQSKLHTDIKNIKDSKQLFVPADKTNNFYKIEKNEYEKLLRDNTTAKYQKADPNQTNNINTKAKSIATDLGLADRIESLGEKQAFVTIKDHKDNFPNHVQCRLINPAKSELGIVSKNILDRINTELKTKTKVNQWKNTTSTIDWFRSINDKQNSSFLMFDVIEFYPSISQTLLDEALDFASEFVQITKDEREIIMHTKNTLLFQGGSTWQKKDPPHLFDVTMGSYDGAECCDLVGIYILNKIQHLFNGRVGLYRDDGLAVLQNYTPSQTERLAKQLIAEFKKYKLRITVDHGMKTVNFLDATLDLTHNSYRPYSKPNNTVRYVNKRSDHPTNVLKAIPKSVNTRLTNISSDEQQFNGCTQPYQEALESAGYKHRLQYDPPTQNAPKPQKRQRKIIWYNPPFSKSVATNVGKKFLSLIDKHFNKDNPLHKIFNRNSVKISYSCMKNMSRIVDAHNKSVLNKTEQQTTKTCNCRRPNECPLGGECLTKGVVYKATVKTENETKEYIGASDTSFKTRWNNHTSTIRNENGKTRTALSTYIWTLKDNNIHFNIKWSILKKTCSYSNISKRCQLCLWEKFFIITANKQVTLNSRSELVNKCRHANKFLLVNK